MIASGRLSWVLLRDRLGRPGPLPGLAAMSLLHLGVVLAGAEAWRALASRLSAGVPVAVGAGLGMAALVLMLMWATGGRTFGHQRLGACNAVTYLRGSLTCLLVVPLAAPATLADPAVAWTILGIGAAALALDGVDGWLARRDRLESAFGARFDVEVDSALALVLAILAWVGGAAGPLVLFLGVARYLFVVASLLVPWLARPLPESFARKAVCVVQLGVLIALQAPVLPSWLGQTITTVAALLVAGSFGRDIRWLAARRA